jgi:hypothetical protein
MKTKKYLFRLVVGLLTLALGVGVYYFFVYIENNNVNENDEKHCFNSQPVAEESEISKVFTNVPEIADLKIHDEVTSDETFYPDGSYCLFKEDLPKGLRDIDFINIEANEWNESDDEIPPKPIAPKGFIGISKKSGLSELKFTKISLNNRLITFETERKNGIHYSFTGEFPKEQNDGNEWSVDLKGLLRKYRDGKQIAKISVRFQAECC